MINFYPANRMENLVFLLNKVMSTGNRQILEKEIILVQSKGMQHWLNMQIARQAGIAMNIEYQMPAQYFWQCLRQILGYSEVPNSNSFTREVMCWRIYQCLATDVIKANPIANEATAYWLENGKSNDLKRYQLAHQLADLFEQYLIYRVDWLNDWQNGQTPHWQALLWQQLCKDSPLNISDLVKRAINKLPEIKANLPHRVSLFGINSLPPLILNFFNQLSHYCQVHFFHLNPCEQYWGDLLSEKQLGKKMLLWRDSDELLPDSVGNPLLANLGQQGKEFLALLPSLDPNDIPVFEQPKDTITAGESQTILAQIQSDILNLHNAKLTPKSLQDNSISFHSSHNRLREIQGLHDWLLHQFNSDPSLTPKDVLVMCPQVEDYAPYIDAVFSRIWEIDDEKNPPLPCSIADRQLKNETPLIELFEQLLSLPDSRFQLNTMLAYLRLPAIQRKLGISQDDLNQIQPWLQQAAIHWGLDANHKAQTLGTEQASTNFTWAQGLSRLLLGFAYADSEELINGQLALPAVEGDQGLLLGSLCLLFEKLAQHCRQLQQHRTASQWQQYLHELKTDIFAERDEDYQAWQTLTQAIDDFASYCADANFEQTLPLTVIRRYFGEHFASADNSQQFMTGQVTFCSMVPMRSVPFKIIAILGLNDGDFPRQNRHFEFDLMAQETARLGDRSRRGDDRYLFLEALLSCREKLYLSFQGKDVKNNANREPSLILKELMDYLAVGYQWQFEGNESCIRQLSLQAFSAQNYQGDSPSFNQNWLALLNRQENLVDELNEIASPAQMLQLTLDDLIRFFDNPAKMFAQKTLGLYLSAKEDSLSDAEPFAISPLDKYQFQQLVVATELEQKQPDLLIQKYLASGVLPDSSKTTTLLEEWQADSQVFSEQLKAMGATALNHQALTIHTTNATVEAQLAFLPDNSLLQFRLASVKGKDLMRLWLAHLTANAAGHQCYSTGVFFDSKKKEPQLIRFEALASTESKHHLDNLVQNYINGMSKPDCAGIALGHEFYASALTKSGQKPYTAYDFEKFWLSDYEAQNGKNDPYIQYLFKQMPNWQEIKPLLLSRYFPLYQHLAPTLVADMSEE